MLHTRFSTRPRAQIGIPLSSLRLRHTSPLELHLPMRIISTLDGPLVTHLAQQLAFLHKTVWCYFFKLGTDEARLVGRHSESMVGRKMHQDERTQPTPKEIHMLKLPSEGSGDVPRSVSGLPHPRRQEPLILTDALPNQPYMFRLFVWQHIQTL